jgi:protein involved in ribonucleotide reduction
VYALFFIIERVNLVIIVFDSLTGQAKKFAKKLNLLSYDITQYTPKQAEEILLVTRTFNFGEIPEPTRKFLDLHSNQVIGVCVSGNRNWGRNYGAAGDKIAQEYDIPLIIKFEASGFDRDVSIVRKWIENQINIKGDQNYVNV